MMKTKTVSDKSVCNTDLPPVVHRKINFLTVLMMLIFICYCAAVLYLVLLERWLHGSTSVFHSSVRQMSYLAQVKAYFQPVPFQTIRLYLGRLRSPLKRWAFINLAGNLVLFLPMGFFLPYFWEKQRNPFRFILMMSIMICAVEFTQLVTLLGACDVDDFILNLAGALIGFIGFHILHVLKEAFYGR